jgi:hypothetical protein
MVFLLPNDAGCGREEAGEDGDPCDPAVISALDIAAHADKESVAENGGEAQSEKHGSQRRAAAKGNHRSQGQQGRPCEARQISKRGHRD